MLSKRSVPTIINLCAVLLFLTAAAVATGSITGRVMLEHEVALLPVVGARVAAALENDSSFSLIAPALTDSGGNYQIDSLPPGRYKVLACKEDIGCLFYPGARLPDSAQWVVVTEGHETSGIDITFRLFVPEEPPSGLIVGLISDSETGAHLPSARVFAKPLNNLPVFYETRSDTDGGYFLPVPPGDYDVFAERLEFEPGAYTGNPVHVDSNDTVRGVNIALNPGIPPPVGFISGRITDATTGNGIGGGYVSTQSADSLNPYFASRSGPEGYYLLKVPTGDLQPVAYNVVAFAEGYEITPYPGNPVLVGANDTIRGIDIALRPSPPPNPALITGRITDAQTGEGIADAWVGASGEWLTIIFQTRTGPDGHYELPVTAGGYFVRAAARGYQPGEYSGNPVRVQAYDTASNVDIALQPISTAFGSISGEVLNDANGLPVPHALVVARQGDGFGYGSALTDSGGHYRIGPLPAGIYKVAAFARGFYPAVYPQPVEVRAGENTPDFNLRLPPMPPPNLGTISGLVTDDSSGTPLECAVVAAVGFDSTLDHRIIRFAFTDSAGQYVIGNLPKIPYFVLGWARGYWAEIYDNVHRFAEATQVTPDAAGIDFALEKRDSIAHTLAGIVQTSANLPLAGVLVQATDGLGAVAGSAISLPDGGFILDGLAPGSYTLSASMEGASVSQNVDLSSGSVAGVSLTLPSGAGLRGDMDGNGAYEPSDAVQLVNAVFLGYPVVDYAAADVNCDGRLTPVDAVKEVQLIFLGESGAVCGF